jgi:hypothetical protein
MDAVQQIIFSFLRMVPPNIKAQAHPAPGVLVAAAKRSLGSYLECPAV